MGYNSSPTQKDFEDVIKELDKAYPDDTVTATAYALRAYKEMEERKLRRTGRTTRIVDSIIQDLFNKPGEWIHVCDHFDNKASHEELFNTLMRRIQSEHQWLLNSKLFETRNDKEFGVKHKPGLRAVRLVIDPKKLNQINKRLNGE